jgi:ABC-type uncharacterized transport system involved in gliding motility auxiliary subunit
VAVNAIASQTVGPFGRIDMTEQKLYTLSDASKEAVSDLEEPIQVKAFISADLPPPQHKLAEHVGDLLEEYRAASGGKLDYEIITPDDTPPAPPGEGGEEDGTAAAARGYGCEKVAIGQRSADEVSVRAVFKCVAFIQGDDTQVIGELTTSGRPELDNFEYDFTRALRNLRGGEPRTIGFVGGFGGPADAPEAFLSQMEPFFDELYGDLIEARVVDLSGEEPEITGEVDALVLLAPTETFTPRALFAIDRFVQRGGSIGWFQSSSTLDRELQQKLRRKLAENPELRGRPLPPIRRPVETGLGEVFGVYGVTVNSDYILDRKHGLSALPVRTDQGVAMVSHPASFMITDIDHDLAFTRDIYAVAMPAPSSLTLTAATREREGIEWTEVLRTAPSAVAREGVPNLGNFRALVEPQKGEEPGPFTVAAVIEGDVEPAFGPDELPEGIDAGALVDEGARSRILVVGSGEFFAPRPRIGFDRRAAAMGIQFLLASLEWLVQDSALTEIRGKAMPRLIGEIPREQQRRIQFINILFVPAFFALIGVVMMIRRRRRKERLQGATE